MITRFQNIWRPWNFHYHRFLNGGGNHFEGWYFKIVDPEGNQPYAFIPGVFLGKDRHAFIQVLDGKQGKSWYHRFDASEFSADRNRFDVRIGPNRFHSGGIELDLDANEPNCVQQAQGKIDVGEWSPWPTTFTSPGVMGPYSFIPFMECNHGILSMDHEVRGTLEVDGAVTTYDGGRGYLEKDWGRSFPEGYVWTHNNHFGEPGISLTASVAKIPWLTGAFRGFLVGFLHDGTLHRFTTYNRSRVEHVRVHDSHMEMAVTNPTHRLEIHSEKTQGALLMAPYEKQMLERVAETMTSTIRVRMTEVKTGSIVYEGEGRNGCLEVQGNIDFITNPA